MAYPNNRSQHNGRDYSIDRITADEPRYPPFSSKRYRSSKEAIAFVAGSKLNFELFKDQLVLAQGEGTALARAEKAIREAKEALDLFTAGV